MSEENLQIVREMLDAFKRGDWQAALEPVDAEMEMDTTRAPIEGLNRIFKGREEVARFWSEWLEAWGEQDIGEPEYIESGDQILTWVDTHQLRGRGSGVKVDFPPYGWLLTVRDGKIVRGTVYLDRAEALEAAGVSP